MSEYAFHGDIPDSPDYSANDDGSDVDAHDGITREVEAIEALYGPGYFDVISVIEAGLEKSHRKGYATDKVKLGDKEISLPQFLATELFRIRGRQELTTAGVNAILDRYLPKPADAEADTTQPNRAVPAQHLAQRAVNHPYVSGGHAYQDFQSAAAHDDTLD